MKYPLMNHGFSLAEMAIVILIIGGIMAMSVTLGSGWTERRKVTAAQDQLALLQEALTLYYQVNGRLPCPAAVGLSQTNANFSLESWEPTAAEAPNQCVGGGGTITAISTSDANIAFGVIPAASLGISKNLAIDPWENQILYYVDVRATASGALDARHPSFIQSDDANIGSLQILDVNSNIRSNRAVYSLLSQGPNSHGAYTKTGIFPANVSSTAGPGELVNCNCAADGTANGTIINQLVQAAIIPGFDDLVIYQTRPQLSPN